MVRVGLPKGVVKKRSIALIESYVGGTLNADKLNFEVESDLTFYMLKHRDIPKLIASGVLDFGITSTEWVNEGNYDIDIITELDWCDTRVSLISEIGRSILSSESPKIRCVTEFPQTSLRFFHSLSLSDRVDIYFVNGSSEAFVPSIFDCCIDCVETGKTLHLHNLREENVIYQSKVVVVSARNLNKRSKNELIRFTQKLEACYEVHTINRMQ